MKSDSNSICSAMVMLYKKRKTAKQANTMNGLSALLRGNAKKKESDITSMTMRLKEAFVIREARPASVVDKNGKAVKEGSREGHVADVILITEGLGNRRNMNYYGPEAIESAPAVFEGKPCFLDHPSESEERDIPERRVRQKCGYFKNCRVESMNGVKACVGELHFDLSDDGEQAYQKACTAVHYRDEFPLSESEYIGLSINADGDVEDRTVQWEGETLQVNYVNHFRDAMSCDMVTSPARGGRFLALVESAAGAKPKKEVGPMNKRLKVALEAARTAVEKAKEEKDFDAMKKASNEADRLFKVFIKEATKAANESEDETESDDMESEDETESESDDGDSHTTVTHKIVKKTGKAAVPDKEDEGEADDAGKDKDDDDDGDAAESKRVAIASMVKEAGIDLPKGKLERLSKLTHKEARAEIADLKFMQESIVKKVIKQMKVPVAMFPKVTESTRESDGNEKGSFLESCIR